MAKGTSRRNKEARKPKADKPAAVAPLSANSGMGILAAINSPKKKK